MAVTLDELAIIVDSTIAICLTNEDPGSEAVSMQITGAQIRVGAGPQLNDVTGEGATAGAAREDYAAKIAGKVMVVGGNPRGLEVHVPSTVVAD
jgi:hypothetical protein